MEVLKSRLGLGSGDVLPRLIKDRTVDWPVVVETLQLATYPGMGQGKLEPDYSIREETIMH